MIARQCLPSIIIATCSCVSNCCRRNRACLTPGLCGPVTRNTRVFLHTLHSSYLLNKLDFYLSSLAATTGTATRDDEEDGHFNYATRDARILRGAFPFAIGTSGRNARPSAQLRKTGGRDTEERSNKKRKEKKKKERRRKHRRNSYVK